MGPYLSRSDTRDPPSAQVLLKGAGQLDEALPYLLTALRVARANMGNLNPETIHAMEHVEHAGSQFFEQGDVAAASDAFGTALEMHREALGPTHPRTLSSIFNLALLREQLGRYDEAHALLTEAAEVARTVMGDEHSRTISITASLQRLREERGLLADGQAAVGAATTEGSDGNANVPADATTTASADEDAASITATAGTADEGSEEAVVAVASTLEGDGTSLEAAGNLQQPEVVS